MCWDNELISRNRPYFFTMFCVCVFAKYTPVRYVDSFMSVRSSFWLSASSSYIFCLCVQLSRIFFKFLLVKANDALLLKDILPRPYLNAFNKSLSLIKNNNKNTIQWSKFCRHIILLRLLQRRVFPSFSSWFDFFVHISSILKRCCTQNYKISSGKISSTCTWISRKFLTLRVWNVLWFLIIVAIFNIFYFFGFDFQLYIQCTMRRNISLYC